MKRKTLTILLTAATVVALVACGQKQQSNGDEQNAVVEEAQDETADDAEAEIDEKEEVECDAELEDYPSNEFEERVGKTSFESYDEIIGLLEGEEAYALVNVKGYDGQVLLVATGTYDDLLGHFATIECTPYTVKSNGVCNADSLIYSGGTANPIAIGEDGVFYALTHSSVEKSCYGENGTADVAIMNMAYVYIDEYDDNGNAKTIDGFIRTKNSVVDDDTTDVDKNDVELLDQLFAEYEKAQVVNFTRVNGDKPQEIQ